MNLPQAFSNNDFEDAENLPSGLVDDPNYVAEDIQYDDGPPEDKPIGQGGETVLGSDPDSQVIDAAAATEHRTGALDSRAPAAGDDAHAGGDTETVEYDQYLLDASGMTAEDAHAQFGSPEALADEVARSDLRAIQYGLSTPPAPAQPLPPAQGLPQSQPFTPQPLATPPAEIELPAPVEGEDWDENTKLLVQHVTRQQAAELARRDAEIAEMKAKFDAIQNEKTARDVNSYISEFDTFVNGLDDSWKPVFGEGDGHELYAKNPNSLALRNREQLDVVATQLQNLRLQQGQPPLPTAHVLKRAMKIAFEEETQREVEQQATRKVAQQTRRHTSRPSMRRSQPLSNIEKACQRADEMYAKFGYGPDSDAGEYDEI
jgi:hypothetical protein